MSVGVDQRALVMLPVDFDEQPPGLAHHLHAHRLVVDEGTGAAIGGLHPPENQVAIIVETVFAQVKSHRMIHRHVEDRDHLPRILPVTHQCAIAARAERERKTVEQNGFSRAGLAGQHRKTRAEVKLQPLDQNDVPNGKLDKHVFRDLADAPF